MIYRRQHYDNSFFKLLLNVKRNTAGETEVMAIRRPFKGGTQLDGPNSSFFYFLCQTLLLPKIVQHVKHRSNGFKTYVQNPLGTKALSGHKTLLRARAPSDVQTRLNRRGAFHTHTHTHGSVLQRLTFRVQNRLNGTWFQNCWNACQTLWFMH